MKQLMITIILILTKLEWIYGIHTKSGSEEKLKKYLVNFAKDDSESKPSLDDSDSNEIFTFTTLPLSKSSEQADTRYGNLFAPTILSRYNPDYWDPDSDNSWLPDIISSSSSSSDSEPLNVIIPPNWRPPILPTTWSPPIFPPTWRPPIFSTTKSRPPIFPTKSSLPIFPTKSRPPIFSTTWRPPFLPSWRPPIFPTTKSRQPIWGNLKLGAESEYSGSDEVSDAIVNKLGTVAANTYPNRDFVCSPVSSMMPLGKLALGATGKTKKELLNALGVSDTKVVASLFRKTIQQLKYLKGVKLTMASAVFVAPDIPIEPHYEKNIQSVFESGFRNLKTKDPVGAANEINKWVSTKTNGKINNLIRSGDISRLTKMILVNAIYFRGTWRYKFGKAKAKTFHSQKGEEQIPFMPLTANLKYLISDKLQSEILQLPYDGGDASMVIVLPKSNQGLPITIDVMKKNPSLVKELLQNAQVVEDQYVELPKFKVQSSVNLATIYKKLHIKRMFKSKKKNFAAISPAEGLHVTAAVQKAIIEVNEEGTEGSAASGVTISVLSQRRGFIANRPFYFIVFANGQQLFSGQFYGTDIF